MLPHRPERPRIGRTLRLINADIPMIRRILFWLAVLLVLSGRHALAERPVLRIGTTDSPPLSTPDQKGMLDRMLKEAFARIGVQVEFVTLPSERSLALADAGELDGDNNRVAGLQHRYANLVQVPESNMSYEFMAFATQPGVRVNGWRDLDRFRVAHVIGWKIFEDNVSAPQVTRVGTARQLFSFLDAGRADVVLFDRIGGRHFLKTLGVSKGYAVEPPLARRDMYLYLNARHAALIPALTRTLQAMKADGSHARYFRNPD